MSEQLILFKRGHYHDLITHGKISAKYFTAQEDGESYGISSSDVESILQKGDSQSKSMLINLDRESTNRESNISVSIDLANDPDFSTNKNLYQDQIAKETATMAEQISIIKPLVTRHEKQLATDKDSRDSVAQIRRLFQTYRNRT